MGRRGTVRNGGDAEMEMGSWRLGGKKALSQRALGYECPQSLGAFLFP